MYINKDVKKQSLFERGIFRPSKGHGLNKFSKGYPGPPLQLDQPLHFKIDAQSLLANIGKMSSHFLRKAKSCLLSNLKS